MSIGSVTITELAALDAADVEEPLDQLVEALGLDDGPGGVLGGLVGLSAGEASFDELEIVVDGRRRRLELVPGRGHQALEAEPHRALGDVADRDHAAPRPVLGGQRLRDGLEPAALAIGVADGELDPEALAPGRPPFRPVLQPERQPGDVLERDVGGRPAEEPVVDDVGRHGPALVVDGDHGVADAGQDRAETVVLLLGLALLLLDGDRLEPQFLGPRAEVLVGDAQLLDRRGQLLVERLELLVGRLEFLVEGLDLLATGLRVLARAQHRLVRHAQLGDQGRQLVVGPQEPIVEGRRLLESLARPGVAETIPLGPR